MSRPVTPSFFGNIKIWAMFFVLFLIYHFPEFLQNHFQKPLILVFELTMLLFAVVAFYFGREYHQNGFHLYGLFAFGKNWGNLIKGLLVGSFISVLSNVIFVWLGWVQMEIQLNWIQLSTQTLLFAIGTLLPSLAEDILTRGYLRAFWPEKWKLYWLIPGSAIVYALNHIFRLNRPDVILYLLVLGCLLMWSYYKTGTMWLTLGIHWGNNIAYQFFTNLVSTTSIRKTGLENFMLAGCFLFGFAVVWTLARLRFFRIQA